MISKSQWRSSFLAATCAGICLVTAYSFIEPTAGNRQVASFLFPNSIPLNSWQPIASEPLTEEKTEIEDKLDFIESTKSYTYSQDGIPLRVEMRYLVGTRGDISSLIQEQTAIPPEIVKQAKEQQLEGIGFHTMFIYQDRAYLNSCINPSGSSTVTGKQFSQNLYNNFNSDILLAWLLGKASIRDRRCLWTQLSIPITESEPEQAYSILEKVWQEWYQWWQPRFPSL
jgi:cyanosortase A-associated protein